MGLDLLNHSERCGQLFELGENPVLQDLLSKLLRIDVLAPEDKPGSYRREWHFVDTWRVLRKIWDNRLLFPALLEVFGDGLILFRLFLQDAENDELPEGPVLLLREPVDSDIREPVGEHPGNMAVQSPLGNEVNQYAPGREVGDAVPQEGPFIAFRFLQFAIPGSPVIGRIEPEERKGAVADPRVLVIRDKALGEDLFCPGASLKVQLDPVGLGLEMLADSVNGRSFTGAGIKDPDKPVTLAFQVSCN